MNFGIIVILAIAGIWALGVFLGAIGGISKTFTPAPVSMDSTSTKVRERQTIQDTEDKRQKMMDDLKQRMEDAKRY